MEAGNTVGVGRMGHVVRGVMWLRAAWWVAGGTLGQSPKHGDKVLGDNPALGEGEMGTKRVGRVVRMLRGLGQHEAGARVSHRRRVVTYALEVPWAGQVQSSGRTPAPSRSTACRAHPTPPLHALSDGFNAPPPP